MPDFSHRSQEVEIMDDLQCQGEVVHQTLRELEFINKWLGGNAITLQGVHQLIRGHEKETLHIADLGCGSGEMLRLLSEWGKQKNLKLSLRGIDANPHIIEFARSHCKDYPDISFEVLDVYSSNFDPEKYDLILGTLFYHHFADDLLSGLFARIHKHARIGFVINDIHRHWLAFHSIRLLTRLFSKSSMVKFDAPLSVRRAFTRHELQDILKKAGVQRFQLKWKWAFRWQVTVLK